ncbi:unnamed protein product [Pleuronectes platessa]|uniref:Uncharacterized protein n=1 Tax=Pleuronectes platessa TaxID=8262 RepID=A0A9N7Y6G3_PLEPL|nr:unnamed protein product [Pleuronectes platessa]
MTFIHRPCRRRSFYHSRSRSADELGIELAFSPFKIIQRQQAGGDLLTLSPRANWGEYGWNHLQRASGTREIANRSSPHANTTSHTPSPEETVTTTEPDNDGNSCRHNKNWNKNFVSTLRRGCRGEDRATYQGGLRWEKETVSGNLSAAVRLRDLSEPIHGLPVNSVHFTQNASSGKTNVSVFRTQSLFLSGCWSRVAK